MFPMQFFNSLDKVVKLEEISQKERKKGTLAYQLEQAKQSSSSSFEKFDFNNL